jgi:glycosyltransferase involved in cell wall biosynthesis
MSEFPKSEKMDANWNGPLGSILRNLGMLGSPRRWTTNARNLGLWMQATKNVQAMETWYKNFDIGYYVRTYPDVIQSGVDPFLHFLLFGNKERRRPSPQFDIEYYLTRFPDVEQTGVNALLHYSLFGRAEGRTLNWIKPPDDDEPIPRFAEAIADRNAAIATTVVNNHWIDGAPLLSVVIPCFNYGQFVERALRCVLSQTFHDLEVIVVEGGSTDGTTVEKVKCLEKEGFPRVRFFYREGRHLLGDNRNFGISVARGRYVCSLDPDDLLIPIYYEVAVFLLEAFGYDISYCSSQSFGEADNRWLLVDASFPEIGVENQISVVGVYRKSAWAHVGGFRDWGVDAKSYVYEDWDFWLRLLGHGFRAKSIREPLFHYQVHSQSLSASANPFEMHKKAILDSNADLFNEYHTPNPAPVKVLNRWANICKPDDDPRPGFLMALPFITVGGAEKHMYEVVEAVAKRGFRLIITTSVMLPETAPDEWRSFERLTPHVYPLPRLFHDSGKPEDFIRYLIRRYRITHLLLAGSETIYHMLPDLDAEFPDLRVFDQLFNEVGHMVNNRHYRRHIDATIVLSEHVKTIVHEKTPVDPGLVHIIPICIAMQELETRSLSRLRASLDLPEDKVLVAFFGRLSEEKGANVFVEIARRLAPDPRFYFLLYGDGPERERVMGMVERYELSDKFFAPGFVKDVHLPMSAVDIVVVPSLLDGMPLVVLESLAHEKAVVASAVGAIPVVIADTENGYLCPPGDVDAFSRRIMELADDPAKRRRLGKAGRASVRRNHSGDRMVRSYFEAFGIDAG